MRVILRLDIPFRSGSTESAHSSSTRYVSYDAPGVRRWAGPP